MVLVLIIGKVGLVLALKLNLGSSGSRPALFY
jgi:hypothetical protein